MVKNKNGEGRQCGDYRRLKAITLPDRHPLLHVHTINQVFAGRAVFSTIDLVSAYHQIPLAPEDREKTAIITPYGIFEFNVMKFGLRNASQTF